MGKLIYFINSMHLTVKFLFKKVFYVKGTHCFERRYFYFLKWFWLKVHCVTVKKSTFCEVYFPKSKQTFLKGKLGPWNIKWLFTVVYNGRACHFVYKHISRPVFGSMGLKIIVLTYDDKRITCKYVWSYYCRLLCKCKQLLLNFVHFKRQVCHLHFNPKREIQLNLLISEGSIYTWPHVPGQCVVRSIWD